MNQPKEDASLSLLTPAPEEKLQSWLVEFYGKPVKILQREVLRHRDLSRVERLTFRDALPSSLIYKQVLPPWDVEQDLHERILIPSISNSAQLFLSAHHGQLTALFLEDLGSDYLEGHANADTASRVGEELAKLHRSYCYRTDELLYTSVLRSLFPIDYEEFTETLISYLQESKLIAKDASKEIAQLSALLAKRLAGEPNSLVHGDLYAENIILRNDRLFIIDWSWFTILGVPIMDLATLAMNHHKNGAFSQFRHELIDAYCYESGRDSADVIAILPYAETLSRLLFLHWLIERRTLGISGTTIGPVDSVIPNVVNELRARLALIPA